ncbi:hypothetical protein [Streptomyces sp. NPDC015414]|uniref:hypothetical protein n=1 Tax=Streptomyces sp. NPDC015414 TaxID=3364957 RepID=UPI0036FF1CE6
MPGILWITGTALAGRIVTWGDPIRNRYRRHGTRAGLVDKYIVLTGLFGTLGGQPSTRRDSRFERGSDDAAVADVMSPM